MPRTVSRAAENEAHADRGFFPVAYVRNGVKLWCRGQRYWTCLLEGNARVDPYRRNLGVVSAAEAEYGTSEEEARLARWQEQTANNNRYRRPTLTNQTRFSCSSYLT
ncbi:ProQ/FINO family protein [Caballeronia sp. S22]|uniref:ProQ/FINO family protein n=1 Tax=Caballeronia sp. S22 TaxID=3137182 RepID=UPI0035315FDE